MGAITYVAPCAPDCTDRCRMPNKSRFMAPGLSEIRRFFVPGGVMNRSTIVTFRLTPTERAQLERTAKRLGERQSNLLRRAVAVIVNEETTTPALSSLATSSAGAK